jgi:dTDP-glucose 4,6-dehydratase
MNILVTGGAGFIGSHLTERLLADDHDVTVVDSMRGCHADNLARVSQHPRLTLRVEDCAADGWQVPGEFDAVYHLAGVAATGEFVARPVDALLVSIKPLERILRWRDRRPEARVLFTSSSEVYGDAQVHPQPESYRGNVSCTGPRSGYDEGKRAGEALILGWSRQHRIAAASAAIVRLFNTYGPRMTANGRLVPTMVRDALTEQRIRVNAPGTQTRTLLFVDDCINALLQAMQAQHAEPVNVGGNETLPVADIAACVANAVSRRLGRTVEIVLAEPVPDEVMQRRPVLDRAGKVLGWRPSTPFAIGLERVIDYWLPRVAAVRARTGGTT